MKKIIINSITIILILGVVVSFATVFSDTYDKATPVGEDPPSVIDNRIRQAKAATQERANVDHYWPLTGTQVSDSDTGEHRKVTLRQTTKPTAVASKAFLYTKDIGGQAEFFVMSEDGVEIQVSKDGKLDLDLNTLANNTAIVANKASSGTVDMIKLNTSDVPALADGAVVAAATESGDGDRTIADKAYVDTVPASLKIDGSTQAFSKQVASVGTFETADISGTVGSNDAIVYMRITGSGASKIKFRKNGDTTVNQPYTSTGSNGIAIGTLGSNTEGCYVLVLTDSSGIFQWTADGSATITATIMAYIKVGQ